MSNITTSPQIQFLRVSTLVTRCLVLNSLRWIIHVLWALCIHGCIPLSKGPTMVCNQLYIHAHKLSSGGSHSLPYRPAVCTACGSPPHTSASPPQICEPQWRTPWSKGCTGCRCQEAPPRIREARGEPPQILHSTAPTRSHLKDTDKNKSSKSFLLD